LKDRAGNQYEIRAYQASGGLVWPAMIPNATAKVWIIVINIHNILRELVSPFREAVLPYLAFILQNYPTYEKRGN